MTSTSRVRRAAAVLPLALALGACSPAASDRPAAPASAVAPDSSAAAAPEAPVPASTRLGTYAVGDSVVTLVDALVIPRDAGELRVLYTPTRLSEEERQAILANPEWPGMTLLAKTGGAYPDRYPYVIATFRYEGTPTLDNMRTFHMLAYGIHEANFTDNINGPVNDSGYALSRLEVKGDRVSLAFQGRATFGDTPRAWAIDTPY